MAFLNTRDAVEHDQSAETQVEGESANSCATTSRLAVGASRRARARWWPATSSTSDPGKVDKRTRSKWSRVLRYSVECKSQSESLAAFIRRKGGINKCAGRFRAARSLRRRGDARTPLSAR
jgi:hypothetical protein